MVNLNREDIRTMLGGSESTERLGAKMKNQLESRGVRAQKSTAEVMPKALSGCDASTGHLVPPPGPDFSKSLFLASSRFEVPGFTSEWSAPGHMAMAELFKNEKR